MNHGLESNFKLGKPPIIEWWIRCIFVPPDDGEPWDWHECSDFLEKYEDQLPKFESLPSLVPQAEPIIDPDSKNFIVEVKAEPAYFRRRTENLSQVVQIGEHELVVSHLRQKTAMYAGFSRLYEEFRGFLDSYKETFQPSGIDTLELHNADIVVIPDVANQEFELSDYLIGAPTLPEEPFGPAFDTDWSISFKCPDDRDIASMSFAMLPPDENDVRFRLDWHYECGKIDESPSDSVDKRLEIAHNYLSRCFRAVFTPFVWDLFDPHL